LTLTILIHGLKAWVGVPANVTGVETLSVLPRKTGMFCGAFSVGRRPLAVHPENPSGLHMVCKVITEPKLPDEYVVIGERGWYFLIAARNTFRSGLGDPRFAWRAITVFLS
jgi:hypothetical protein